MNHHLRLLLLTSLLGFSLFLSPSRSQAKENQLEVSLNPSNFFIQLQPGQSVTHTIKVTYSGQSTVSITPQLVDFLPDNKTGWPLLLNETDANFINITSPVKKFGESWKMEPNSTAEILLSISPTQKTLQKEYTTTLLLEVKPAESTDNSSSISKTTIKVGSNIIAFIGSEKVDQRWLSINQLKIPWILDSLSPMNIDLEIKNTGPAAAIPIGRISVLDWQGKEKAMFDIAPDLILGNSQRIARRKPTETDQIETPQSIIYDPGFLLGVYQIKAELLDPANENSVLSSTQKSVLALPMLLVVILMLSVVVYVLFITWQWQKRKQTTY